MIHRLSRKSRGLRMSIIYVSSARGASDDGRSLNVVLQKSSTVTMRHSRRVWIIFASAPLPTTKSQMDHTDGCRRHKHVWNKHEMCCCTSKVM